MKPGFPLFTLGGKQLWADEFVLAGYRIQQNVVSGRYRLLDPDDIRLAGGSWEHCKERFDRLREARDLGVPSRHRVLLLHGVFRSKDSFGPMTRALRRAGYDAQALNYPSTRRDLHSHAAQITRLLERSEGADKVSFVCHSMGGIVARMVLGDPNAAWRDRIQPHRLVTIATPHRGAEIAEQFAEVPIFEAAAGPSVRQLHRDKIEAVPLPTIPFGTIAGGRGDDRGYNPLLPGDDDFTVTVDSTRLPGAEDHLLVRAMHTFIMVKPEVIAATIRYLRTGRFQGTNAERLPRAADDALEISPQG